MHQFRDKKQILRKRQLTRNLIGLGIFLILSFLGVWAYFGGFLNTIGLPIWKAKNTIVNDAESMGYVVRTKASVFRENQNLLKENTDLKNSMIDYQLLKKENEELKSLLSRIPVKANLTLATILTKPNASPYDTIIIDVGSDSNIKLGEKVYADEKSPIGEISKVYTNTSLVELYSNPEKVTKAVMDGTNTSVDLVGRGGGNFQMIIPHDLPSDNGAMVVLPNLTSEIIAIIDGVISMPADPNKKVILHSPINVQSLKWVLVKHN